MPGLETSTTVGGSVRIMDPLKVPDWDARLASLPNANFFHSVAWARVLNSTYGYAPVYFTTGGPDYLLSLLPTMEINSWLTGRRGISLPFTDECAPLASNSVSFSFLLQAARKHAEARRWKYLECRGGRSLLHNAPALSSYYAHYLPLQPDERAQFGRIKQSARGAIKKGEQNGLTIEFSQTLKGMRDFYTLFCITRQRHGVPPQPFSFFENIHRHVMEAKQGWVVIARRGQQPVASSVFFHFGKSALYKFSASDDKLKHLSANNLVLWNAIRRYALEGYASLDFGRTTMDNEGLRKFKLSWGTDEQKIDYWRYDCRTGGYLTESGDSAAWYNPVFRFLPGSVSRLVGSAVYKHIA